MFDSDLERKMLDALRSTDLSFRLTATEMRMAARACAMVAHDHYRLRPAGAGRGDISELRFEPEIRPPRWELP